ncbi:MAG TPA: PASTA domain-containing protein [Syntrophales bacterium]|nr:PASTA domain-containing protein [Syntrophales bacterium]
MTSTFFVPVCVMAACLVFFSTAHAANVTVPNVVGMPGLDANKAIQKAGLNPQYSMEATPTPDKTKADKIVKQEPVSGRSVPAGSVVTLYVYMYQPPAPPKPQLVKVPDVTGKKNTDAYKLIESAGLHHADGFGITGTPDKSKLYTIARQDPAPGQSVAPGSVVTLVVYNAVSAPDVTAKVPNVTSLTSSQAKQTLANSGFKRIVEYDIATNVMSDHGKVFKQSPSPGTTLSTSQNVTLWIGLYKR